MLKFFKNFFINLKSREHALIKIIKGHLDWDRDSIKKLFSRRSQKFKFPNLRQLRYLPSLLNKKERVLIILSIIFIIISLSIFFTRFYRRLPLQPVEGGEYIEGIIGQIDLVNPLFNLSSEIGGDINRLIFSGLVKWESGKIIPDLAEKWEIDQEGRVYIFYLKKNVFWHDGKEFSADDIIFTIQAIQDEETNSPLRTSLINVKVEKLDEYTIKFSLERPFSPFLTFLSFGFLPKHLWQDVPREKFFLSQLNLKPIGTGPFQFKKWLKDEGGKIKGLTLEKNKKYYQKPSYLEKISFKIFEKSGDAFEAIQAKNIEGLSCLSKEEEIENIPKIINFYQLPLSYYTAIFFNQKSEILKEKKIREALALFIDKQKIAQEVKNAEKIESAIVNPKFISEEIKKYENNPSLGEEVFKNLGWQKKEKWLVNKKNEVFEIKLIASDHLRHKKVVEIIKNLWETQGVKINLEILNKEDFEKNIKERKYDVLIYSIIEGYDPDPFSLWHSSQIEKGLNLANFKNIKIDTLLEKARITLDESERKKYYQEFQEIISKEIPAIFLYRRNFDYWIDSKIKGFAPGYFAFPSDRFANIENWYIKTGRSFKK